MSEAIIIAAVIAAIVVAIVALVWSWRRAMHLDSLGGARSGNDPEPGGDVRVFSGSEHSGGGEY